MNREEIENALQELDVLDRLAAAKEAIHSDVCSECGRIKEVPADDKRLATLDKVKQELHEIRVAARANTSVPESGDGIAATTPVITAASKEM